MKTKLSIQIKALEDKIYRFALKLLCNKEDAKDVVQDVYEKLLETSGKHDNIEAFAMKITKNICLDKIRRFKMITEKHDVLRKTSEIVHFQKNYDESELLEITKQLVKQLPDKQRMIIHLRDIEGYEFDEIQEILEIDINAIRMNLSRARKTIKTQIIKLMNHGLQ